MSKQAAVEGWVTESWEQDKSRLVVMFRNVQVEVPFETARQNRPIFKEVTHIVKMIPGDKTFTYDQPIKESEKKEFAQEWAHWCRTNENKIPGIPIEMWHQINDTQKAEFKAMKIQTVEQFADLPDSIGANIMGFFELRNKAKAYVATGRDAEANARKDAEINALKKRLSDLEEKLTAPAAK